MDTQTAAQRFVQQMFSFNGNQAIAAVAGPQQTLAQIFQPGILAAADCLG
jgi:hypothetical protein